MDSGVHKGGGGGRHSTCVPCASNVAGAAYLDLPSPSTPVIITQPTLEL